MSITRPIHTVSNSELYNRWARVYDTDGNILQAIDDINLPPLLTQLFTSLPSTHKPLTITELGAGTGRNTLKLLSPSVSPIPIAFINALDISSSMLKIARERCTTSQPEIRFYEYDVLNSSKSEEVRLEVDGKADVVLSTLVLEHLPLEQFFEAVKALLKESGWLVLTNMHAEMGKRGQAGFVDEDGTKVRGQSFVYEVEEVLRVGKKCGFKLVGEEVEVGVEERDVGEGRVLGVRGRKWIGCRVWFGMVFRLR